MKLPFFLLEEWLTKQTHPVTHNLASSAGLSWTLGEIFALGDGAPNLNDCPLNYGAPEGSLLLREAIAAFCDAEPDWVVVTTGASEALSIINCVTAVRGAEVLLPDPGYPAYHALAMASGITPRHYRLDSGAGYTHSRDAIASCLTPRTVGVVVNTPHNPTGAVMPQSEIASLARSLGSMSVPLIVDEVYRPIHFGLPQPSAAGLLNVIVVGDMSKALSLPGLRIGWIIDQDADRRRRLINVRGYFTNSSPPIMEKIAAFALRHAAAIVARAQAHAFANHAQLERFIGATGGRLAWSPPLGGTTAFPWFDDGRDTRIVCTALAARGILLAPGDCFGHPAHFRVNLTVRPSTMTSALVGLRSVVT